jgi:hypothetical protein
VKNAEFISLAREVARKTLNLGLLKRVSIPLAPTAEQEEIVMRVGWMARSLGFIRMALPRRIVQRCAVGCV